MSVKYGDKGSFVASLQQELLAKGYELPQFGVDGDFGDETLQAVQLYCADNGLLLDIFVPERVLNSIFSSGNVSSHLIPAEESIEVLNLRDEQTVPSPKSKVSRGATLSRDPAQVRGVVIHQTACVFGVSDNQVRRANGDRKLAKARRSLNVACHALAFRDGFVALPNKLEYFMFHGNGFNASTLGLEIEGKYPGDDLKPRKTTWGGDPTEVTEEIIYTARYALKLLVEEGRSLGMPIENVYAHRQSSATRRSDPGESLWKRVVLDYGVPILGLKVHNDLTVGTGKPIPKQWDPSGTHSY
jgi:hypothetical protein